MSAPGALYKSPGKTGTVKMNRFQTTPDERRFIKETGGIETHGTTNVHVPYYGAVQYVPDTDTYWLDEGDQVIPAPTKTEKKPIDSLQQGTNYVKKTGPYGLHAGEIVQKPYDFTQMVQKHDIGLNPYEDLGTNIYYADDYRRRKNQEGSWGIPQKSSPVPAEDLLLGDDRSRFQFESMRGPGYDPYEDYGGDIVPPPKAPKRPKLERDAPGYIPMGPTLEGGGQLFQGSMWQPYDYKYNRETGELMKVGGTEARIKALLRTGLFGYGPGARAKAATFDLGQAEQGAAGQKRVEQRGRGTRRYV